MRASLDGDGLEVLRSISVMSFHNADMIEHPRDAADGAKLASLEEHESSRRGAAAVIGKTLDDHGHLVRAEAFISHEFVIDLLARQPRAFFDRALNSIAGHGMLLGGFDRHIQTRVQIGIGAASLRRDDDFLGEFAEYLPPFQRARFAALLFPLCAHGNQS